MTDTITKLIFKALSDFDYYDVNIEIEEYDIITIEVVSDEFIGVRLMKRIDLISSKIIDLQMNELSHYHLQVIPLTVKEKYLHVNETGVKCD